MAEESVAAEALARTGLFTVPVQHEKLNNEGMIQRKGGEIDADTEAFKYVCTQHLMVQIK